MNLSQFRVFRDIAQSSSISRAAQLNQISQSAASQCLKGLEKHLGVDLIDRRTRPLRLTPAGRVYYEAARDIVRRFEEMEVQLQTLKQELAGVVRVASIYSIGLSEMASLKEQFETLHPQAHIHLDYMRPDKIYEAVEREQVDFGLVSYPAPGRDMDAIEWRRERMALVCHPRHALATRKVVAPEELARKDFISFDPGLSIRRALDRFFREHNVHREVALEFDNIQMIKEALSLNQGVSILPERTVRQEVAEGRLTAIPIAAEGLVRPVGILFRRRKRFSRATEQFLRFLRERAES